MDDAEPAATLPALIDVGGAAASLPALLYGQRTLHFAEIAAESRRVAGALAALGIGAGDRVAIWLPNVPAWLTLLFACARLGAVAVALNTRFRSAEVGDILSRSGAKLLVMWPGFKGIDFAGILADVPAGDLAGLAQIVAYHEGRAENAKVLSRHPLRYADLAAHAALARDAAAPSSPALIFTTSGTTKAPKFVLHSQASLTRHARAVAAAFGYDDAASVILQSLPLCGTFGLTQALASLAGRRPMILQRIFDATEAAALIRQHKVTGYNASDEMLIRIFDASEGTRPFPSLRAVGFANFGVPVPELFRRAEACQVTLTGLYGASEVQAFYARQPPGASAEIRATAGGFPVSPLSRVRVREPESGALLPPGQVGELEAAGPSRMLDYFGDEAATARGVTEDGFVRTGDLGYLREDGSFVYLTRMGDVLRLGGFLVAPAEIEDRLQSHPSIAQAQVVAAPSGVGQRAVAFVILRPAAPFDEAALREHCASALARFKVPVRVIALDAFPITKSANGEKIQRTRLRDMAVAVLGG